MSWMVPAVPASLTSVKCDLPSEVPKLVGRSLFVTYSPNCKQFGTPPQGRHVDLVAAPQLFELSPPHVVVDGWQPTRVVAFGTGLACCQGLRVRIAGRLATGLRVFNDTTISFIPPQPPMR
eukprot:TRINITY_DN36606_c0_g1_i1.p1 TRINITY_DN36606_c0_g1~~TRINITY_DN36606_c0_g1_i1.p1  ORF type:complete len:121 (-),score=8.57 TRINITY_DN36606_c0_g1_i1:20-382(-)